MICETCHDGGMVLIDRQGQIVKRFKLGDFRLVPCPDCGGSRRTHCCEGERPAPEPPTTLS